MKRVLSVLVALGIVSMLAASLGASTGSSAYASVPPAPQAEATSVNLLLDGNMEDQPYYWEYPNHFIAPYWNRWWNKYAVIPEYDDTRIARVHYEGDHAQVYFKWGARYEAGIYQVVTGLTPCTPYKLSAYARTHSLQPPDVLLPAIAHARVGLDPEGTQLTPDQHVGEIISLPGKTVWSPEQTALFVWEQLSVVAEPIGNRLTAILYASPQRQTSDVHYYDSYWDAAVLEPTTYANNRFPVPSSWGSSSFFSNVVTEFAADTFTVSWDTAAPAYTQVWYDLTYVSQPVTPTSSMTATAFFPIVSLQKNPVAYSYSTSPYMTPTTHSSVQIPNLQNVAFVSFVIMAHRSDGTACVTEAYGPRYFAVGP